MQVKLWASVNPSNTTIEAVGMMMAGKMIMTLPDIFKKLASRKNWFGI